MPTPEELAAQEAETKAQAAADKAKEEQEAKLKAEQDAKAKEEADLMNGEKFDPERAKALIEKLRAEVKESKPLAKKLAEYEAAEAKRKEAEMTELQKAQAKIEELEKQNKASELRELRRKVGEAAKLPAAIYELLPELSEEEMKVKADELAKAMSKQPGLSPNNPNASPGTVTDAQRRSFLYGNGPLPK